MGFFAIFRGCLSVLMWAVLGVVAFAMILLGIAVMF